MDFKLVAQCWAHPSPVPASRAKLASSHAVLACARGNGPGKSAAIAGAPASQPTGLELEN